MSEWEKRRYSFCEEMDSRDEEIAASIAWEQGRKDVLSNLHELTTEELLKDERVKRLLSAAVLCMLEVVEAIELVEGPKPPPSPAVRLMAQALAEWESE